MRLNENFYSCLYLTIVRVVLCRLIRAKAGYDAVKERE